MLDHILFLNGHMFNLILSIFLLIVIRLFRVMIRRQPCIQLVPSSLIFISATKIVIYSCYTITNLPSLD